MHDSENQGSHRASASANSARDRKTDWEALSEPPYDLLIKGGEIVSHMGHFKADIGVKKGLTAAIGDLSDKSAHQIFDAKGLTVLPGVIDSQVHFREPGLEHKEDLETGSRAAVLGGVTAVFEMPNTKPSTLNVQDLEDKLKRAKGRMWCDHAFYAGASATNLDQLPKMEKMPGCAGVKIFMGASTGDLLVADDATLLAVLKKASRRVSVHAEDEARLQARQDKRRPGDPSSHNRWRDSQSALIASERLINLARRAERRVHILHVSTAEEMAFLASHKDIATIEVTPQHLSLHAPDCYNRLGAQAQMNPPIRSARHQEALWRAIENGLADVIGSDHAPHLLSEKQKYYPESPSGMPGVQTLLPLLLNHVAEGRLSLMRLVDLTSTGPQRIFGLRDKGRLAVGWHADYTLVDLKAQHVITASEGASKAGWTPFEGQKVKGMPVVVFIRGERIMQDGNLVGKASGAPIRFIG